MKKTLLTISISLVIIIGLIVPVFAATPSFVAYCSYFAKEDGVARTKEVTFNYAVKDFVNFNNQADGGKEGINVFRAVLEYDENIFEKIEINQTAEGYFNGIKTKNAKGEKAIKPLGNWTGLTYNPETKRLVLEASKFINFTDEVVQVTLKVKPNATLGNTTIKLKSIEGSDQVKDIYPAEISKTVEIIEAIGEPTDADPENGFGGYLRIVPDMLLSEFKAMKPEYTGDMKNSQGTTLASGDFIPTGSKITAEDSRYGTLSYTIIAMGDLNSDGKCTATDLSQMKAAEVGTLKTLTDDQKRACDIKWDAKYTTTDRSILRCMLVGIKDPKVNIWYGTGTKTCVPVQK